LDQGGFVVLVQLVQNTFNGFFDKLDVEIGPAKYRPEE